MGSYPHQGGRWNTPLRGGERGQSKEQEHVCTCRFSSSIVIEFKMINLLSDRASGPSCHSLSLIRLAYSRQGPRSSAAEGQWSHLRSQFELHPPCEC